MARTKDPHAATLKAWKTRAHNASRGGVVRSTGDFAAGPSVHDDGAPYGPRQVVRGKFLNEGKVSVRFPGGSTRFLSTEAEAQAEADRMVAEIQAAKAERAADDTLIGAALSGAAAPKVAERAFARAMGGASPSTMSIAGFVRQRYGTTITEARRHAERITRRRGFVDSSGTSRACILDVIEYLREHGGEIQRKG